MMMLVMRLTVHLTTHFVAYYARLIEKNAAFFHVVITAFVSNEALFTGKMTSDVLFAESSI